MIRSGRFTLFFAALILTGTLCNNMEPEEIQYGSISGKVQNSDTPPLIRIVSEDGVDTAAWNSESQTFTFPRIKYGSYLLQIEADGYRLYEETIQLGKPQHISQDIILAVVQPQISHIFPMNGRNLDTEYFSQHDSSVTDSGFRIFLSFNQKMDTASVIEALTISPDTVGVRTVWDNSQSFELFFPYWMLVSIDTLKVSISTKACNQWQDALGDTYYVFFPVNTHSILACSFCTNTSRSEEVADGSITGRILHPDNNLMIRILSEDGNVDTTTRDSVTQQFTFNQVKTGKCILQVRAEGYGFYEQKFVLNKPQFICHNIILAQTPSQIAYLSPSNSQNFDSVFFSIQNSAVTDTGIQIVITFNDWMDSNSVYNALSIFPDTVGVKAELVLSQSLAVFFPYWKLVTIDTVKIVIDRGALDRWDNPLDCDYNIFFPVETSYIRTFHFNE